VPAITPLFATTFVFNSVAAVGTFIGTIVRLRQRDRGAPVGSLDVSIVVTTLLAAIVATEVVVGFSRWLPTVLAIVAAGMLLPRVRWWRLHRLGTFMVIWSLLATIVSSIWVVHYVANLEVSSTTRTLLAVSCAMGILALPTSTLLVLFELQVLLRDVWTRPNLAVAPRTFGGRKVSVHMPCHAEPPEMVIASLDALSRLHYDDFEVIVVDNNTEDPRLWQPVAEHCQLLGERFRFYHVSELAGAKAGALNYALARTAPDAEVIALVDADYAMEPNFLNELVGHFDDPQIAFIQCRYDFRDWSGNRFMMGCYWEYLFAAPTTFRGANQFNIGFPMGTACILRRQALVEVGGWAEWSLTEDSEVSIRLYAAGYSGYMFRAPYGKGLIPETFAEYKRQRYRWVYGPVQTFKHHWRLHLPGRRSAGNKLSAFRKLLYLTQGLEIVTTVCFALAIPVQFAALATMIAKGERPPIPPQLWVAVALAASGRLLFRWCLWHYEVRATNRGAFFAGLTIMALAWTRLSGALAGTFTKDAQWRRTNKFTTVSSWRRGITATRSELIVGTTVTVAAGVVFSFGQQGLFLALTVNVLIRGLFYLAAPVVSLLSEYELRKHERRDEPSRRQSGAARRAADVNLVTEELVVT
jgi:glycosyltransferase involved in cell wall biosynthesis